jgi:competence protein ComGC
MMKKAFTIIELVISLIIFWVGLLLVLLVINKNVTILKKVELTTTATLIAKDQMAIFYNFRDSNDIKYKKWNYITWVDVSQQNFEKWKSYKVWTDLTWNQNKIEEITTPNFLTARLYYKTWVIVNQNINADVYSGFYYTYDASWKKTFFARWISLTWVVLQNNTDPYKDEILKLKSIVKYRKWSLSWEVVLESFISNWK